jgi:hypothetical protein
MLWDVSPAEVSPPLATKSASNREEEFYDFIFLSAYFI